VRVCVCVCVCVCVLCLSGFDECDEQRFTIFRYLAKPHYLLFPRPRVVLRRDWLRVSHVVS